MILIKPKTPPVMIFMFNREDFFISVDGGKANAAKGGWEFVNKGPLIDLVIDCTGLVVNQPPKLPGENDVDYLRRNPTANFKGAMLRAFDGVLDGDWLIDGFQCVTLASFGSAHFEAKMIQLEPTFRGNLTLRRGKYRTRTQCLDADRKPILDKNGQPTWIDSYGLHFEKGSLSTFTIDNCDISGNTNIKIQPGCHIDKIQWRGTQPKWDWVIASGCKQPPVIQLPGLVPTAPTIPTTPVTPTVPAVSLSPEAADPTHSLHNVAGAWLVDAKGNPLWKSGPSNKNGKVKFSGVGSDADYCFDPPTASK